MNKKERLEAIIGHYCDGKPSLFAKFLGVAPSTISSWLSRDTMDYDLLFAKCENLSADWLLTGNGNMMTASPKKESRKKVPTVPPPEDKTPDNLSDTIMQLVATISRQAEEIGRLKETIRQLQRQKGKDVSDAPTSEVANVG